MKKIILSACIIASFLACKKEKEEIPVSPGGTPGKTKHCTATVNGNSFAATTYSAFVASNFYVNANSSSSGLPIISLSGTYLPGTYSFYLSSPHSATYTINNVSYLAKSGTITINQIDTAAGYIQKLDATFNFNTDTVSGVHYQITNGDIYYTK